MTKTGQPTVSRLVRGALLSLWVAFTLPVAVADQHSRVYQLREQGAILPLETILQGANLAPGERIIEVEFEEEDGVPVYEIEFIGTDGYVRERLYNAKTGKLIKEELEND